MDHVTMKIYPLEKESTARYGFYENARFLKSSDSPLIYTGSSDVAFAHFTLHYAAL